MEPLPRSRPWRVIAAEIVHETDPQRLSELIKELDEALDEYEIAFASSAGQYQG
jgi:hypothetical protein